MAGAAGAAGVVAAAGAAVMGLTPTIAASPQLMADVYYVPGTKIGTPPTNFPGFVNGVVTGTTAVTPVHLYEVPYPAGFFPVSTGGLSDPTYDSSVGTGVTNLNNQPIKRGDVIFGYSQGAVVASKYKAEHAVDEDADQITYVLVENPNRPNGGVLERFNGLYIPILDVSFNGATPETDSPTVDVSRQYDGWSDFPAYPLNVLADANAIAGIYYLHGSTQEDVTAATLEGIDTEDSMHYQEHGNTTYYLIPTGQLPILMPFNGIVPDPVLKALDPPLRYLIELGYDREDYSTPTPAGLFPTNVDPITVATGLAGATVQGVEAGLAGGGLAAPAINGKASTPIDSSITKALPKLDVPKLDVPKLELPKLVPSKPRTTISPLSDTLTKSKPTKKASDASPVKSIQSAVKSITKNLAPKPKPKPATDSDSSKE